MAYLFLLFAISAEVFGTSLLKATDGFTRLWPTLGLAGSPYPSVAELLARMRAWTWSKSACTG